VTPADADSSCWGHILSVVLAVKQTEIQLLLLEEWNKHCNSVPPNGFRKDTFWR